jgi:phage I-like protein
VSSSPIAILSVASVLPIPVDANCPDWIMVVPAGISQGVDGRGPYNNKNPAVVAAQSMQDGRPIALDYNHQTLFACLNGGSSPAAGWIDKLEAREGALWGHVDWTDAGRTAVASREYRFVSPAFNHDKAGEVQKLVSVGLVNMPNLRELPALNSQLPTLGDPMDKELLAKLAAACGLPADATMDQITAHCAAANKTAIATGAPNPAEVVPMSMFIETNNKLGELTKIVAQSQAGALVDDAVRAGKVTPAMKDWALTYAAQSPDGFKTWCAASPVIVTPGVSLPNTPPAGADAHAAQQDEKAILAVCSQLGVTIEQYRKTLGIAPAQTSGDKA